MKKNNINKLLYFIFIIFIIFLFILTLKSINVFEKFDNNELKYKLSVLAIFKNETMNLQLWIDHYLWQGVEHFYLIDNGSTDNPDLILNSYINQGIVTLYKLPEKHKQVEHYKTIWKNEDISSKTKWLIMADLDEFWFSPKNKLINIIDNYDSFDIIYSNWKMFGSDGNKKHPKDIRTSILYRTPTLDSNTKWICKTKNINVDSITQHKINDNKLKKIIVNDNIHLNHYPIQSKEFFEKVKLTRGDVINHESENIRDWKYFDKYDENMTYKDTLLKDMIS
jgi:hypothetical protein